MNKLTVKFGPYSRESGSHISTDFVPFLNTLFKCVGCSGTVTIYRD